MTYNDLMAAAAERGLDPLDAALLVAQTLFRLEFYESATRNMEFLLNDGKGRDIAAIIAVMPSNDNTVMKLELDL